ncbi:MAG: hypothetical protein LAP85_24450 [Acidobacteriia bacterium]|nr:hypothetical protein [Terriglobia bacterium]
METEQKDKCYRHCLRFGQAVVVIAAMIRQLIDRKYTGSFTIHFCEGKVNKMDQHASYSMDEVKKISEAV